MTSSVARWGIDFSFSKLRTVTTLRCAAEAIWSSELKGLMPEDVREAFGHGVRAKRSKVGAVSFEAMEASDAPVE
jgi:hypothetical protein